MDFNKLTDQVPDNVIAQIAETAAKSGITSGLRLAHFLAQCGHESGGFKSVSENLNYGASGLLATFPKYFDKSTAAVYERKPEMIAARVYANRMGNGDEASKDGYVYRGRGYIQLTGRTNYTHFATFIGEDTVANPDLVAIRYPLASAAYYFVANNLWPVCDKGSGDDVVTAVTKKVNGGTIGLDDRIKLFKDYYALLM